MKNKILLLPALLVTHPGFADTVQNQVAISTSYFSSDWETADINFDQTSRSFAASYTRYISPLETDGVVQQELAFVRRASFASVYGSYSKREYDVSGAIDEQSSTSSDTFGLSGQYFVNENVFVRGHLLDISEADDGGIGVGVGYYYGETSSVQIDVNNIDDPYLTLSTRSLVSLNASSSLAYSVGLSAATDAFSDTVNLHAGTTYYLNNRFGLGISSAYNIEYEEFSYRLFTNYFFNERVGLEAWVNDPDEDFLQVGASLVARF
jgi:hypothetical protein